MKKSIQLTTFLVIIFSFASNIWAQGEAAVPFLLIAPGARPCGMGEAGVALADEATAVFWNPAGLAFQYENPEVDKQGEISVMHVKWLPQFNFSDLWYDYLAGRYYIEDIGMGDRKFFNLIKIWDEKIPVCFDNNINPVLFDL